MRPTLAFALAISLCVPALVAAPRASADGPIVVLDEIRIVARGPEAFTMISRSRVEHRADELREHFVREIPRTVERAPF